MSWFVLVVGMAALAASSFFLGDKYADRIMCDGKSDHCAVQTDNESKE
jgi:hypothetical protein